MKQYLTAFLLLFSVFFVPKNLLLAQRNQTWSSSRLYYDLKLQGPVKTWTMKNEDGFVRQQQYDRNGNLIKDSCVFTLFQDTPPDENVQTLKADLEKTVPHHEKHEDTLTWTFNERGQLLQLKSPNLYTTNAFTPDGKIVTHKKKEIITQTRAWNSHDHDEPTYTFTDTLYSLAVFKYNAAGLLKEFESFNTNSFLNFRWTYTYDSLNNLVEMNFYDYINQRIPHTNPDKYLDPLMQTEIDSTFSINNFYEEFWTREQPYTELFKYNESGKKTETTTYGGYRHELSSKTTWEYDVNGNVMKEIQYDVYHNLVQLVIEFDDYGNAISETRYNTLSEPVYSFYYEIVYY